MLERTDSIVYQGSSSKRHAQCSNHWGWLHYPIGNDGINLLQVNWLSTRLTLSSRGAILIISLTHTERQTMKAFVLGTVFGLILATVGFSGIARIFDKGIDTVKTQSQELAK